jgi:hypothetical protein
MSWRNSTSTPAVGSSRNRMRGDAGGRFVEKQDARFVRQRLGDQHSPLHAAGKRAQLAITLVP